MNIDKRLLTIANMVQDNSKIIDIGCDHGFLDIYLTLYKNVDCIASDISEKCIKKAELNFKKYHLESKIKTVVSNGLEKIDELNRIVVISGMGTHTIIDIIKDYDISDFIIQSNNKVYELRSYLTTNGYYIYDEQIVLVNDIYYPIIYFKKGFQNYTEMELRFGPFIKNNKDYINYLIDKNYKIFSCTTNFENKESLKKQIDYLKNL